MQRRTLLAIAPAALLAGCGFQLRQAPNFAFQTLYINTGESSPVGNELRRSITSGGNVTVVPAQQMNAAQVILDVLTEQREKVVVGLNASGQVREFQLRSRLSFRLRNQQGREIIPSTEILQQRDISFNESAVLSKEAEEALLYRDMQTDIVQQLLRRLAAVREV
ncbi:MAG: LPS assembly lipoprotein LptE [Pseudomonadota bacterium]